MTILLKHHIQQHNTMKINQHFAAFAVAAALASCGTTDTEPPTVCDSDNLTGLPSILAGELEVEAGTTVTIHDAFCDNDGLAEIRWDLHSAEGHAHEEEEEGEEHEGEEHEEEFILWSGGDFEKLEIRAFGTYSSPSSMPRAMLRTTSCFNCTSKTTICHCLSCRR